MDQIQRKPSPRTDSPEVAPTAPAASRVVHDQQVDDLLDDIDSVLETNAESFVKSFVQKGGQ